MRSVAVLLAILVVGLASGCSEPSEPDAGPRARPTPVATPVATRGLSPDPSFDVEAWRAETIERFGPETEFQDGTKLDYVRVANEICALEERPDYEDGSLQEHMVETYCPYV